MKNKLSFLTYLLEHLEIEFPDFDWKINTTKSLEYYLTSKKLPFGTIIINIPNKLEEYDISINTTIKNGENPDINTIKSITDKLRTYIDKKLNDFKLINKRYAENYDEIYNIIRNIENDINKALEKFDISNSSFESICAFIAKFLTEKRTAIFDGYVILKPYLEIKLVDLYKYKPYVKIVGESYLYNFFPK